MTQRFARFWVALLMVGGCTGVEADTTTSPGGGAATLPASTSITAQHGTTTSTSPASTSTTQGVREFSTQVVGSFTFDEPGSVAWLGVDVGSDGLPVAFQSSPGGWLVVACDDWACSQQTTSVIDVGETHFPIPASIQFAPSGLPVFTTPATEHEPPMPMTIHACKDRACSDADKTAFPTDQEGWVAVAETGFTFIGVMDGQPMLSLFHSESPDGFSLTEVSGHAYWGRSLKAEEGENGTQVILADRRDQAESSGLSPAVIAQCDDECEHPAETKIGAVGIWELTLDPMAAPRGGTSAFLAGSVMIENPRLVLVTWRNDPTGAVQILLDEFPGEDGEIQGAAIAVGPTGNPVVVWNRVYYEFDDLNEATELYVARCDTPNCSTGTIATLHRGVEQASSGGYVGVGVGPDDNPVLIYDNWNLTTEQSEITLTRCIDPACTTTAFEVIDWSNE